MYRYCEDTVRFIAYLSSQKAPTTFKKPPNCSHSLLLSLSLSLTASPEAAGERKNSKVETTKPKLEPTDTKLETTKPKMEPTDSKMETTESKLETIKRKPPRGEYVIQVPKDQIYRIPPPDAAEKFKAYTSRVASRRRPRCCRFLLWSAAVILILILAAGVLCLLLRPHFPSYAIDRLWFTGFNSSSTAISVTIRAVNMNEVLGIEYRRGGNVAVLYSGVELCGGVWPAFYQGPGNETVFDAELEGSAARLPAAAREALEAERRRGRVALEMDLNVPVRVIVGAINSWTFYMQAVCHVVVDKLTAEARILSAACEDKLVV